MDGYRIDDTPRALQGRPRVDPDQVSASIANLECSAGSPNPLPLVALPKAVDYVPPRERFQLEVFTAIMCILLPQKEHSALGRRSLKVMQKDLFDSIIPYLTLAETARLSSLLDHRQLSWDVYGHQAANEKAITRRRLQDALTIFPSERHRGICRMLLLNGYLERMEDKDMRALESRYGPLL